VITVIADSGCSNGLGCVTYTADSNISGNSVSGLLTGYVLAFNTYFVSRLDVLETITFETSGTIRDGVGVLTGITQLCPCIGASGATADVDGYTPSNLEITLPIELGTVDSITAELEAGASGAFDSSSGVFPGMTFSLAVFEADGVTPVTVTDAALTPEPGSLTLSVCALALGLLGFCSKHERG
jgi:hypothetical protein